MVSSETAQHIPSGLPMNSDEPEKSENPCGDPFSGSPPNRRNSFDITWPNIIEITIF
jgi:hypothetical protein